MFSPPEKWCQITEKDTEIFRVKWSFSRNFIPSLIYWHHDNKYKSQLATLATLAFYGRITALLTREHNFVFMWALESMKF